MTTTHDARSAAAQNESAIIRRLSCIGIFGNILLCSFKLFAGLAGNSGAMVSDAIHSLSDVFATLIAFLGIQFSKKDADREHPYGHERMECLASLSLGIILLLTGLGIGKAGLFNILSGDYARLLVPKAIALIAAIVSIAVKEAMFWYTRYYAKRLDSAAFMADAWHHRSDALSSIGSLIGISGAMLGFPVMDAAASLLICFFILKVAYDILRDAVQKLLDTSCGETYEKKLSAYIAAQDDVLGIDVLRTRMFGNRVYADLEIRVDGEKSLTEAHAVAENVRQHVETEFSSIKRIMIHVNPAAE